MEIVKKLGLSTGLTALSLLAGCGGGGSIAGAPASGSQIAHMGPITASYSAIAAIVPIGSTVGTTSFAGLTGANFTSINFQAPKNLDQTLIAYIVTGSSSDLWVCDRFGNNQTPLAAASSLAAFPAWSSDGRIAFIHDDAVAYHRLYVINLDGTGMRPLSPGAVDFDRVSWSPDNTKIAYVVSTQIYVIPSAGGTPTLISDGTSNDNEPSWAPDGKSIIFSRRNASVTTPSIYSVSATGGTPTQLASNSVELFDYPSWSPDGLKFAYVAENNGSHLSTIYVERAADGVTTYSPSTTWNREQPSWSPDGRYIVYMAVGTTSAINVAPFGFEQELTIVSGSNGSAIQPAWQPFPRVRFLIGSGAVMGTTCSGFLFAQQSNLFTGFLSFSATTPSTATITSVAGGATNSDAVFSVGGDTLTHINYFNGIYGSPVTAIPTGGLATAKGALVSFDTTGQISFVLPYSHSKRSISKTGAIVFEGEFLGAWDKKGKNTMPHGATQVVIDGHSGKVLGVR